MSRIGEKSELTLALLLAGATLLGVVISPLLGTLLVGADTERETNTQLVQLAIGILSEPLDPEEVAFSAYMTGASEDGDHRAYTASQVLRGWAVDTINEVAPIKFADETRSLLLRGTITLPFVNPGNAAPMKNGLAILGFGGMLMDLPTVTDQPIDGENSTGRSTFNDYILDTDESQLTRDSQTTYRVMICFFI